MPTRRHAPIKRKTEAIVAAIPQSLSQTAQSPLMTFHLAGSELPLVPRRRPHF